MRLAYLGNPPSYGLHTRHVCCWGQCWIWRDLIRSILINFRHTGERHSAFCAIVGAGQRDSLWIELNISSTSVACLQRPNISSLGSAVFIYRLELIGNMSLQLYNQTLFRFQMLDSSIIKTTIFPWPHSECFDCLSLPKTNSTEPWRPVWQSWALYVCHPSKPPPGDSAAVNLNIYIFYSFKTHLPSEHNAVSDYNP